MKPNVGMMYPMAAEVDTYTKGSGITYKTPFVVSEARGATLAWETGDGEFYGDNVLLDSDKTITGYTLDFEPAGLKSVVRAKMLGETVLDNNGGYRITEKNPPDLGFAYVKEMREDDETTGEVITTFEAWFFYKIKYRIESEEARTKEKTLEWRVPTMNGKGAGVYLDDSGDVTFADHQDFASVADARAWIQGKFGAQAAAGSGTEPASGSETGSGTEPASGSETGSGTESGTESGTGNP